MSTVFEVAVYLAGSAVFAALAYTSLSFYLSNKKLANYVIDMSAQLDALQKRTKELMDKTESKNVEGTEAFVRFVSQSRDKAFEYIEDVQSSIYQLKVVRGALDISSTEISEGDLEILRNVVDNVLKHLPEDSQND
jgi:hypothetical protein